MPNFIKKLIRNYKSRKQFYKYYNLAIESLKLVKTKEDLEYIRVTYCVKCIEYSHTKGTLSKIKILGSKFTKTKGLIL